jgi:hypothetical protein
MGTKTPRPKRIAMCSTGPNKRLLPPGAVSVSGISGWSEGWERPPTKDRGTRPANDATPFLLAIGDPPHDNPLLRSAGPP